jgi:hypothetical protein
MLVTSEAGWEEKIHIEITQSRINHITIISNSNLNPSSAMLAKKGKKITGTFRYDNRASNGGTIETYELDGKIIAGNHRNTITGTYTCVRDHTGYPGPSTSNDKGTFIINPE